MSFEKMKAVVLLRHPYEIVDGEPRKIRLCQQTGSLLSSFKRKLDALDELGIGVSIYFKLLKSLVAFFAFCSVICTPLYYLYSCGDMSAQATGDLQKALGEWTLGNLGESTKVCKSNNLRVYDTLTLWCPAGTNIRRLEKFGLQKEDAKPGDNVCP